MARRGTEIADVHACGAGAFDAKHKRCAMRKIENAVADERPAIVDAHDHFAPVFKIGDLNEAWDRQCRVCGGDGFLVVDLAACGAMS